jgi:hypothetical protein
MSILITGLQNRVKNSAAYAEELGLMLIANGERRFPQVSLPLRESLQYLSTVRETSLTQNGLFMQSSMPQKIPFLLLRLGFLAILLLIRMLSKSREETRNSRSRLMVRIILLYPMFTFTAQRPKTLKFSLRPLPRLAPSISLVRSTTPQGQSTISTIWLRRSEMNRST